MNGMSLALFASLMTISGSVLAADYASKNLVIQATPSSEGTVLIDGKPFYEKTFNVVVFSKIKEPIKLTGFVGCYKAFDEKGNEFEERLVQADLLGTLKEGAKEGEVSFTSNDDSVYNAKFVKWSSNCPNIAKSK
ncbi:DUF4354 family protein (plasmid) [Serratia marcescens]|jgi:hypothetical protein|uniref:DUF4354 family protein n=1 Tax=Serratia marcescens TaxID=615 RepID=UPI0015D6DC3D|nr:DUF4354 family protein [Serratia marcescens]QLJ63756.1 DUF4354 family protein [Serratia marcescens]BEM46479.1 hypothetical protein SME13J_50980 [Serratia marcescens]HEJ7174857.1 DUF4354 family protein [Serratia marcescens]